MGGCILATIPQFFYLARQAMPDMLLTCWITLAAGCFALARFGETTHRKRYFAIFYAAIGLAFLTKGPVACVLTLLALFIFWGINIDKQSETAGDDFRIHGVETVVLVV